MTTDKEKLDALYKNAKSRDSKDSWAYIEALTNQLRKLELELSLIKDLVHNNQISIREQGKEIRSVKWRK